MKYLSLFLLISLSTSLFSQNDQIEVYDTAAKIDPSYTDNENLHRNFNFNHQYDSSMQDMQVYDRIKKQNPFIQNLGDIGSAFKTMNFSPFVKTGFVTGLNNSPGFIYDASNIDHYSSKQPFSQFSYAQGNAGKRGLIHFNALHTQNFGKNINISAKYNSTAYDGFYLNQTTSNKTLQLSSYFRSKNNRYLLTLHYDWNKLNRTENGGIETSKSNDTALRESSLAVRAVPVSLNTAKNNYRYRDIGFKQTFWLVMDADSNPALGISHNLTHTKESNYYTDLSQDYPYYDSTYYYSANYSADSIYFRQLNNNLEVFTPLNKNAISFKAGAQYDIIKYAQIANSGNYFINPSFNLSIYGSLDFKFLKTLMSKADARLYLSGYNAGDYKLQWNNSKENDKFKLGATLSSMAFQAPFMMTKYKSNHYQWQNAFSQTAIKSISLNYISKRSRKFSDARNYAGTKERFQLNLNYYLVDRMFYFNENANPSQGAKGQNCLQFIGSFNTGTKNFRWNQQLLWQTFSNDLKNTMLLPELASRSSFYFQGYAFKKASFVQIGIDANFSSSNRSSYYNPGILSFQQSNVKVGAYPYLDFFINAEIKTARIFVKMEHFNQDIPNEYAFKNYSYASPYYPTASRRLRIGFVWKFYY